MKRKDFIKVVAVSAAALATPALAFEEALAKDNSFEFDPKASPISYFPQSVMSGDPTPDSVILWTRVNSAASSAVVSFQVSKSKDFKSILSQGTYTTDASLDYTVRIKLTGLQAYTHYYYRFIYQSTASKVGRTKTAPAPDSQVEIKFGYISCQDYTNGYYSALRSMAKEELDFVVHLGDYIYETVGQGFQGGTRNINLPDGVVLPSGGKYANSVADYRTIYQTYRSDTDLQTLNESFPLIAIWDDHEYSDDCFGATATYFNEAKDEFNPPRRKTANRVWYEYMPVDILAYDDAKSYDNSLKIYRNFKFGSLLELVMTDERLYRSEHLLHEGPANPLIGKAAFSEIGSRYFVPKAYFEAVEGASPAISMLGTTQKQWFKDKLKNSTATWKFWGNEVSLTRMLIDLTPFGATRYLFDLDQWDGYNKERSELMKFIKDNAIKNAVSISGDIHAFFVGKVFENYNDQTQPAVSVDFTGAGVSSTAFYYALYGGVTQPGSPFAALEPLLRYNPATDSNGVDDLLKVANPNIKHVRSLSYGYTIVKVKADSIVVSMKEVAGIDSPDRPIKRVFTFLLPAGTTEVQAVAVDPDLSLVRFAHLAPAAPKVDIYVNKKLLLSNVAFGTVSAGYSFAPGNYAIEVFVAGANRSKSDPVIAEAIDVYQGGTYTFGVLNFSEQINTYFFEDKEAAPATGKAKIKLLHASPNAGAVDVAVQGGPVLFSNLNNGEISEYLELAAGSYKLEVRAAGSNEALYKIPALNLLPGAVYTAIAEGLVGGSPAFTVALVVDVQY